MNPLLILSNISLTTLARKQELDGIEHLVIPCIAIKEGVLNNIFYSASELESFANTWNGVPVPVNHPMDANGSNITANNVVCESTVNIGRFYNVEWDSTLLALKGEIWLNIPKAKKLGYIHIIERLEKGEVMEVSTGLYGNTIEAVGSHNNVNYQFQISNIRPDHLALLPNEVGACSIKDGCGAMRTNESKGILNWIKKLFVNEQSFDQVREAIYQALKLEQGKDAYPYIIDVFNNYFIYEYNNKFYRRSYTIEVNGNAILVGENTEVRLERKYVPVSAEINNTQTKMNPKKRNAIVNALALALSVGAEVFANHDETKLEDAASKYNLNFDDEGTPITNTCGCTKPVVAPVVNVTPINNGLSTEQAATLARLQANEDKRLDAKRAKVLEVNKAFTKEIVATLNEDALDALLVNVATPNADFSVSGATIVDNTTRVRPAIFLEETAK